MFGTDKSCCYRGGERHEFRARYDKKRNKDDAAFNAHGTHAIQKAVDMCFDTIYVCDICVWCGKVVNRANP